MNDWIMLRSHRGTEPQRLDSPVTPLCLCVSAAFHSVSCADHRRCLYIPARCAFARANAQCASKIVAGDVENRGGDKMARCAPGGQNAQFGSYGNSASLGARAEPAALAEAR